MNNMNNNPMNLVQQFMQFKNSFNGNPQAEIQRLLQNGQLTQQQLNNLQTQATQLQQMFRSIGIRI